MPYKYLLVFLLFQASALWAQRSSDNPIISPNIEAMHGGIWLETSPIKPENLLMNGKPLPFFYDESKSLWFWLIPLPVNEKRPKVSWTIKKKIHQPDYVLAKRDSPIQSLSVDPRKVELSPPDLKRAIKEKKQIKQALAKPLFKPHQKKPAWDFKLPIKNGIISSPFGVKRVFNGQTKGYHQALDIAHPIGTPVSSIGDGVVLFSADLFFAGQAVYVDHGYGLIAVYFHLSKRDVTSGQWIKRGQKIGEVGESGRVTGPHLHFGLQYQSIYIDPSLFIQAMKTW